jgi:transposase
MKRGEAFTKDGLVMEAIKAHLPYDLIRLQFHVSPEKISKFTKWFMHGNEGLPQKMKSGRKAKVTQEVEEKIEQVTLEDPFLSSKKLAKKIFTENSVQLSHYTVSAIQNKLHFSYKSPRKRPSLTELQKAKRIAFVKHHLEFSTDLVHGSIISDESTFKISDDSQR